MPTTHHPIVRFILGDQLNYQHSWFLKRDNGVLYVLMEMRQETDYVTHHIQKVVGFFAAMRAFAQWLEAEGHQVLYLKLDDQRNLQSLPDNLQWIIEKQGCKKLEYLLPDEYRLDEQMRQMHKTLGIEVDGSDTEHFLTTRTELAEFFKGKKTYLMESFYRQMRRKHSIMMVGKDPITGQWNYDADNRKSLPDNATVTPPLVWKHDVQHLVEMINQHGVKTIGSIDATAFPWHINREQSLELLNYFVQQCLPLFGTYEDAMHSKHWSVFHSRLSFSMNLKILSPLEVVHAAIKAWEQRPDKISIAQIEGFVRQIIGWREYMRGIYWAHMPSFAQENFFEHKNALPKWYWTGETKMRCMQFCVGQSLDKAYAHHIQRLMVTGNFALLAGVHPDEVDQWYLGVYIDAIEWVEITNTRGMSQFADGGIVGTKPYVSSANYISKMSNYCKGCHYDHKSKTGERACPFNSLYWHFYDRHRDLLERNPRIGMMYRVWDKMDSADQKAILVQADGYLGRLDEI
jgi:deoxyribodipyrimidine photolyase-related protein